LDSDNWRAPLPAEQPTQLSSANVPHWPGSDSDESDLDARLGRQPHHWATPLAVFKWTSRRPGPVGATPAFGRPGSPTEFRHSDRRWPRARNPVPGRNNYFNSSNLVAIPPTARLAQRTNLTARHETADTDSATAHKLDQSVSPTTPCNRYCLFFL
jgi:hypothetical protein